MDSLGDKATAYHEAGHAVMALALARPVQRVSMRPNHKHLGLCEFGKGVVRPSEDWLEREILISLGGIAAEAIHTGDYAWDDITIDLVRFCQLVRVRFVAERVTAIDPAARLVRFGARPPLAYDALSLRGSAVRACLEHADQRASGQWWRRAWRWRAVATAAACGRHDGGQDD